MKFLSLAFAALLFSGPCFAKSSPTLDPKRTLTIVGEVGGNMIPLAQRMVELSKTPGDIDIVISSPGGSVAAGTFFITALELARARGSNVRCYVTGLAASMAFQIFAHCDERYALPTAYLLWHPVRAGFFMASFTPDQAAQLAEDLKRTEKWATNDLISRFFEHREKYFWKHYHAETLFIAEDLAKEVPGLVDIVDDVPGANQVIPEQSGGAKEVRRNDMPYEIFFRMHDK